MPAGAPITVVICDDSNVMRVLVRRLLEDDGRFEVVGEAENARACVSCVERLKPDRLVLDQRMPDLNGVEILPRVIPHTTVIMFSSDPDGESLALSRGAVAYLAKGCDPTLFLDTVAAPPLARSAEDPPPTP